MEAARNFLHSFKKMRRFWRRTAEPNLRFLINGSWHFCAFFLLLMQAIWRFLVLTVRMSMGWWGASKQELAAVEREMMQYDIDVAAKVSKRERQRQPGDAWGPTPPENVAQPDFTRVGGKKKKIPVESLYDHFADY